jgi:hypothetical protein
MPDYLPQRCSGTLQRLDISRLLQESINPAILIDSPAAEERFQPRSAAAIPGRVPKLTCGADGQVKLEVQ